ncbi:MAG: hypothetical protein ABW133_10035, partial [Polyangiaceae bacterium]
MNCPSDCLRGSCGNLICEPQLGEASWNCPSDCKPFCGDGFCQPEVGESSFNCPSDCRTACGDRLCQPPETALTCQVDCGF